MTVKRIAAIAVGIALIPLPGPGWPIVFAGLAMVPWLARFRAWVPAALHAAFDKVTLPEPIAT